MLPRFLCLFVLASVLGCSGESAKELANQASLSEQSQLSATKNVQDSVDRIKLIKGTTSDMFEEVNNISAK